jgi:hypothetical protein
MNWVAINIAAGSLSTADQRQSAGIDEAACGNPSNPGRAVERVAFDSIGRESCDAGRQKSPSGRTGESVHRAEPSEAQDGCARRRHEPHATAAGNGSAIARR